jgi:hypothetical protein
MANRKGSKFSPCLTPISIVFSRGKQSTNLKFTLNGFELEIVNEFNYLGILFNRTGNFNKLLKSKPKKLQKQCLKF